MRIIPVTAAVAAALVVSACSGSPASSEDPTPTMSGTPADVTVLTAIEADPDLSTLASAVDAAGLAATLDRDGPFTVFAPTNEAFDALAEGVWEALLLEENRAVLVDVIAYHVLSTTITSDRFSGATLTTFAGEGIVLTGESGPKANDANVVEPDIEVANGLVHVIDAVLIPGSLDVAALIGGSGQESAEG